eukprot:362965-Chlamydomonas_euryale.AAC.11
MRHMTHECALPGRHRRKRSLSTICVMLMRHVRCCAGIDARARNTSGYTSREAPSESQMKSM